MPTIAISKTYLDGQVLTQAELDSAFTSIETFLNTTRIDGTNIQDGSIGTTQLGSASVTSAKIAAGAVGTSAIANSSITAAKLSLGALDRTALTSVGQQVSSSSSTYTHSATNTPTDVTNLTVTITTTGRPVWVGLMSDGNGVNASSLVASSASSGNPFVNLYILRGSTVISLQQFQANSAAVATAVPPSAVYHIDFGLAAGTYTYKVQATGGDFQYQIKYTQLVAFEMA